ncbi:ABC transporter permease [Cohnella lubricantis]|uniref:ABC transporter permease n=1 Tax=Cohnella lubricantis TaxID=2163172 RepID=A0A841TAT1_9BACL|nr:ABC transporter permease [Cohnella lubricantis]MBB6677186.1 ABC transporter permease [Cohnella lubricantis]MBP2117003.1 ABC-type nitrate/sulfonate/bicarbonate transport system permease component [Cohnella lubricantis]
MASRTLLQRFWLPAGALALLVLVWQLICKLGGVDPWILPAPSAIAHNMWDDSSRLWSQVWFTLRLALKGIGLGIVIGVAAALLFHLIPGVRAALSPIIIITQNIPLIALGPLLIVWFGFGLLPKLILLVLVCFFPIAWSMLSGLGQAEPHLREYLAMIGASRWEVLWRLELPASLPSFFTGLKLTATYSITAVIVAEWLGSSEGIGHYLVLKSKGYDTPGVFSAIACIVALALLFYGAAALLERLAIRWRPGRQAAQGGRSA